MFYGAFKKLRLLSSDNFVDKTIETRNLGCVHTDVRRRNCANTVKHTPTVPFSRPDTLIEKENIRPL